jgi:hypothetical protein
MCGPKWGFLGQFSRFFLSRTSFLESPTMPVFRNCIPQSTGEHGYDLKRTPANGSLQGIITCEDVLVCDTHFFRGRTTPCERTYNEELKTVDDSACQPCVEKIGFRTHVYVSVFDVKKREHFIFECTAVAAKALSDYKASNGTLRGCILYACRPKGTKNSKVSIETNTANLQKMPLPNPPDIQKALCVIWRIPLNTLEPIAPNKKNGRMKTNNDRLSDMRNQPDNVSNEQIISSILQDSLKTFL